jgi:hypothetical protein
VRIDSLGGIAGLKGWEGADARLRSFLVLRLYDAVLNMDGKLKWEVDMEG